MKHTPDFEVLFKRNPLPMWMFDAETLAFVEVNDAAVHHYGYTRDEFLAMTLADIRPADEVASMREVVRAPARLVDDRVWHHRKKDGSLTSVQIRATAIEEGGRPLRLAVVHDVSDRERAHAELGKATEQLRHAQKMEALGRLAGGIAHDFNNLITAIQTYASFLAEDLDPSDPRRADASEIIRVSERATGITRQLLAMSRHSIVDPRPLRLHDVVAELVSMLRRVLGEHIELHEARHEVPPVLADRGHVEQVLMNLAVNARDAMPDGGRLTIETRVVDDQVELSVSDTGMGMDAETQRHIFEPFFTTKGAGVGTGLGLSIVHGIVSQAGGTISVYSEKGRGATFRIRLPITTDALAGVQAAEPSTPAPLPKLTVLVVDDSAEIRAVAARTLRADGCTVLEVASADAARRACVSHDGTIDVALIDIVLPDGRGDALANELRDLRPSLATVLSSGYPAGALSARGSLPADLLPKPYRPGELRAAIARAVQSTLECEAVEDEAGEHVLLSAAARARGPRVLVIEDDLVVRRSVAAALRASGSTVVEAGDGLEGASLLGDGAFDVVLSDVHMPQGGGVDVMRAVRASDLDIPVILMSGTPDVASAAAAVEYGAFRYLTKPLEFPTLIKLVAHAARAHALARLRREAYRASGAAEQTTDRAGLEVRFERAIERMWLAYQPIVDARTHALFGVEALLRSDEPSMAGPSALLDAATRLGQLPRLGRRLRAQAAADIAGTASHILLFVNLHPDDLDDVELVTDTSPLAAVASRVVLECTERAALHSSSELTTRIERLRALGFRLAVDDIGAGYSGLTSFTQLTPELVKIDMSLVRDVHTSRVKQRTIGALCQLCHEMESLVVGEGVETVEERDCLVSLGCDLLQGYLLGRPARELPAGARTT